MNNHLKKIVVMLSLSAATITPTFAAISQEEIELATAILRLPCSILEYNLRNSSSRSACFTKALIHANRLVNEMAAKPPFQVKHSLPRKLKRILNLNDPFQANMSQEIALLWLAYDMLGILKNLVGVIIGPSDKQEPIEKADKFQNLLGYIVFPLLESAAALSRVKGNSFDIQMPMNVQALALKYSDSLIMLSRLGQLGCSAPQTSLKRKIYAVLVLICIIDLVVKAQKPASEWDVVTDGTKRGINNAFSLVNRSLNGDRHDAGSALNELFSSKDWPTFFKKIQVLTA